LQMILSLVALFLVAEVPSELRVVQSLCAEAALNIQLERRHKISATYAAQMRELTRDQLQSEAESGADEAGKLARLALPALRSRNEQVLLRLVSEANRRLPP
jgi:hypothetical protein